MVSVYILYKTIVMYYSKFPYVLRLLNVKHKEVKYMTAFIMISVFVCCCIVLLCFSLPESMRGFRRTKKVIIPTLIMAILLFIPIINTANRTFDIQKINSVKVETFEIKKFEDKNDVFVKDTNDYVTTDGLSLFYVWAELSPNLFTKEQIGNFSLNQNINLDKSFLIKTTKKHIVTIKAKKTMSPLDKISFCILQDIYATQETNVSYKINIGKN